MEHKLLRSQKNEVFEGIQQRGLHPSDFKWFEIISKFSSNLKIPKLIHQPTGHYYIFGLKNEGHWTEYSPGKDSWMEYHFSRSWENQRKYIEIWLDYLKKESMPDLWEAISKENILGESRFPSDNDSLFNPEEQEQISKRLYEIERYLISTQNLSTEYEEFVRVRLNYLEESSKHQNRRDWLHTMIGVFFTIIMGIGLSSSAANELFKFASHSFNDIFGILTLP